MPWVQDGFMDLSGVACKDFETILTSGLLHGMPYFPYCDTTKEAAQDDHVSQTYCKGNQFHISQKFVTNQIPPDSKAAGIPYIAPYGQVLDNLDPPSSTNTNFKPTSACSAQSGKVCMNGFLFNQNTSSTNVQRLTKADNSYKYKIAVYHGGLVGAVSSDVTCFSDMYGKFADFVIKREIDIVITSLQMPILPTINKPSGQFLYNLTADAIITKFYSLLPSTTTVGMLAYINPKDSSWDFQSRQSTTYPNATPQSSYDQACKGYGITTSTCFVNDYIPEMTGGAGATPPSCDSATTLSPWCLPNQESVDNTCPNSASQLAAYIAMLNKSIQTFKASNPYTGPESVTLFAFDNEDEGLDTSAYCHAKNTWKNITGKKQRFGDMMASETAVHAAKRRKVSDTPDLPDLLIGSAGNNSMLPSPNIDDFVMPEIYWNTNDLEPCTGSGPQYGALINAFDENGKQVTFYGYPQVCTTGTSYRQVGDQNLDGGDFYTFLKTSNQAFAKAGGTDMFGVTISNFAKNEGVWPMMSCENLSGSKDVRPDNAPSCLARAGQQGQGSQKLCGSFDGISYWTWDQVIQFFNAFYEDAFPNGDPSWTPVFAIYELQFIPPSWMCDDKDPSCTSTRAMQFTPPDTTLMPNCKAGGGGGGGGGGDPCTDLANDLSCDKDQICIDFANKNASVCGPYYGECRTWDTNICQFHPKVAPPSVPCAPTTSLACTADTTCQDYVTANPPQCSAYTGTCVNQSCLFTPTKRTTCNQPPMSCKTDTDCIPYATGTCSGFNAVCRTDSSTPYCDFYQTSLGDTCDPSLPSLPVMCAGDGTDLTPCSNYITANPTACKNYDSTNVYCNNGACHLTAPKDGQHDDNQAFLSQVPHKRHDMQLFYASYSTTF
jgi:hypothetical protein